MARQGAVARRILATRTDHLPVLLSEPEIREAGRRLAQLEGDLAAHGRKEKEIRDALKGERSAMEGRTSQLAAIIRQGYEHRPTPVRIEADYKSGRVFEIREDTGEVIGDRPLNETDRQAPLFDAPPPSEKAKELAHAAAEAKADAILANAGDGALNDKSLKGKPEAWTKGGRRG